MSFLTLCQSWLKSYLDIFSISLAHQYLYVHMNIYLWLYFTKTGVYTKNRNFRLYKSSKVGKNAAFTVADDNKFIDKPQKGISAEESMFLASLVCNVRYNTFNCLYLLVFCGLKVLPSSSHSIRAYFCVCLVSQVRKF